MGPQISHLKSKSFKQCICEEFHLNFAGNEEASGFFKEDIAIIHFAAFYFTL